MEAIRQAQRDLSDDDDDITITDGDAMFAPIMDIFQERIRSRITRNSSSNAGPSSSNAGPSSIKWKEVRFISMKFVTFKQGGEAIVKHWPKLHMFVAEIRHCGSRN